MTTISCRAQKYGRAFLVLTSEAFLTSKRRQVGIRSAV